MDIQYAVMVAQLGVIIYGFTRKEDSLHHKGKCLNVTTVVLLALFEICFVIYDILGFLIPAEDMNDDYYSYDISMLYGWFVLELLYSTCFILTCTLFMLYLKKQKELRGLTHHQPSPYMA